MTDGAERDPEAADGSASEIPESFFGYLSPELPAAIGRIVMLSALLESRVAALASSVENKDQSFYFSNDVGENIRICERRLPLYDHDQNEKRFAQSALALVHQSKSVLTTRNAVVHRVWPKAGLAGWGGWKPLRKKERGNAVEWSEWTDYTPQAFETLVRALIDVIENYATAIATAGSLPRRPDDESPHGT